MVLSRNSHFLPYSTFSFSFMTDFIILWTTYLRLSRIFPNPQKQIIIESIAKDSLKSDEHIQKDNEFSLGFGNRIYLYLTRTSYNFQFFPDML